MKLTIAAFLLFSAVVAGQQTPCTHGKLFVSDNETTSVHVFDVSAGGLTSLVEETAIPVRGQAGINLNFAATGAVAAIYRGDVDVGYTDGAVTFIDSDLKVIENAGFECARAIHFVRHDDKIAIFCDGSYDFNPQVNSTVWVVDEAKFGAQETAIVFQETLQGSHHGVAVPVDIDHVLYSLASKDRIDRTQAGADEALPSTFQVVDYQGNVLHSITDESSPDTSCAGFHGSWAQDNRIALACDDDHGGILIVDYDDSSSTYTSRALMYPNGEIFSGHRTGSFAEHHDTDYIIGNFAGGDSYHIMAFEHSDTTLREQGVLTLENRQCSYELERGRGEELLVFMPTGMLHVFGYGKENGWTEKAKVQIIEDMVDCSEAIFVPGIMQAFIFHKDTKMLYAVDVEQLVHKDGPESEAVSTLQLDFFPYSAVVGGAPPELACKSEDNHDGHDHGDHDGHDHGDHDDHDHAQVASGVKTSSSFWMALGVLSLGTAFHSL